jgi:hypothetical protein
MALTHRDLRSLHERTGEMPANSIAVQPSSANFVCRLIIGPFGVG